MHVSDAYVYGISGRNSFKRRGECETLENPHFRKMVKR